jgi:predicted metal-dependent phosphoesterase TrpH
MREQASGGGNAAMRGQGGKRAFVDLHCHTSASFDCLSSPAAVVRAAASRGLTHLAVTDHETIAGALEARDIAREQAPGLTVLVGEEVRTREGDLIAMFIERAVPRGMSAAETIAAIREQGGLVGVPHPFDRYRGSLLRALEGSPFETPVDWIEVHNARVMVGDGNAQAAAYAADRGLPGVAVSDAHSVLEVGVAYTAFNGDPSTADGLLAALPTAEIIGGRASYYVRLFTPMAKVVQRLRGHRRPVAVGDPT